MASTVQIPLVGGTADGQTVTVELDSNGRPPLTHHHLGPEGLAEAEIYELESAARRRPASGATAGAARRSDRRLRPGVIRLRAGAGCPTRHG